MSDDLVGSSAIRANAPIELFCKPRRKSRARISWILNGRKLNTRKKNVKTKGGKLTINSPVQHGKFYEGTYRCVSSNIFGAILSRPITVKFAGK